MTDKIAKIKKSLRITKRGASLSFKPILCLHAFRPSCAWIYLQDDNVWRRIKSDWFFGALMLQITFSAIKDVLLDKN